MAGAASAGSVKVVETAGLVPDVSSAGSWAPAGDTVSRAIERKVRNGVLMSESGWGSADGGQKLRGDPIEPGPDISFFGTGWFVTAGFIGGCRCNHFQRADGCGGVHDRDQSQVGMVSWGRWHRDWLDPLDGDRAAPLRMGGGFKDVLWWNDERGFDRRGWWRRSVRYVAKNAGGGGNDDRNDGGPAGGGIGVL